MIARLGVFNVECTSLLSMRSASSVVCSRASSNLLTWPATWAINRQEPAITIAGPATATNLAGASGEADHSNADTISALIGPMNSLTRRIHDGPGSSSQTTCADRFATMDPRISTVIPDPTASAAGPAPRSQPGHPVAIASQTNPAISTIPTQLRCGRSG